MLHMPTTTPAPTTPAPAALPATAPLAPTWAGHEILDDPITAGVLLSVWSGDPAVVVPAPPGSGKSRLVVLLAATLAHRAGLRVGIAAQTRAQATELATRFNALPYPARLRWGKNAPEPDLGPGPVGIMEGRTGFTGRAGGVCIATTARWLLSNPHEDACDVMIVDEAWQATYADLGALGAFATQLVAVGDPGQIDPVVTGSVTRWADKPTAPHLPSPTALTAAHGDTLSIVKLRHTYRLGPATTALIQPVFYPDLPFTSRRPHEHLTHNSHPLPELAHRPVTATSPTDPNLAHACATLARDLLTATYTTATTTRPLTDNDLAVVTPHVAQAATIRAMLPDHPGILIGTANSLQGLERAAVIALHPLAGYRDPNTFTTDLGRACVMLSRHRTHLTVVTDTATTHTLATATTPEAQLHAQLLDTITTTPTH